MMNAMEAMKILQDKKLDRIKTCTRKEIAGLISYQQEDLELARTKAENQKMLREQWEFKARKAKRECASVERCIQGMCCFCENGKIHRRKCSQTTVSCEKKRMEVAQDARVPTCKLWKFKEPEAL